MDKVGLMMKDTQRKESTKDEKRVTSKVSGIFKNISLKFPFYIKQE